MKFPSFQDPTGSVHKKVTKVMGVVSFHIARVPILLASMPNFLHLNFFPRCRNSQGCEHFGLTAIRIAKSENESLPSNLLSKCWHWNCLSLFDLTLVIKPCGKMQQRNCWKVTWKWPEIGTVFHLVELRRWWGGKIRLWTNTRCEPQLAKNRGNWSPTMWSAIRKQACGARPIAKRFWVNLIFSLLVHNPTS